MGSSVSKSSVTKACEDDNETYKRRLEDKIRVLEGEMNEIRCKREKESEGYEQKVRVLMCKEAELKRERKRLKEEVGRLRKKLEEKEERIREMEEEMEGVGETNKKEWELLMMEHMREEQARREESVDKWKRLYLAIKTELDHLIHRTHQSQTQGQGQGERMCLGVEDEMLERLQRELKAKDETMEVLKARIAAMEKEGIKRESEVDILRQSLRIMSNTRKTTHVTKNLSKSLHL